MCSGVLCAVSVFLVQSIQLAPLSPCRLRQRGRREGQHEQSSLVLSTSVYVSGKCKCASIEFFLIHSLSIVIPTAPSFNGSSYLEFTTPSNIAVQSSFYLLFQPTHPDGVILYSGNITANVDFFSISLVDSEIQFRFELGSGTAMLIGPQIVLGEWYSVVATRMGKTGTLEVNDAIVASGSSPGTSSQLNAEGTLQVGGVIDFSSASRNLGTTEGFVGCISVVQVRVVCSVVQVRVVCSVVQVRVVCSVVQVRVVCSVVQVRVVCSVVQVRVVCSVVQVRVVCSVVQVRVVCSVVQVRVVCSVVQVRVVCSVVQVRVVCSVVQVRVVCSVVSVRTCVCLLIFTCISMYICGLSVRMC